MCLPKGLINLEFTKSVDLFRKVYFITQDWIDELREVGFPWGKLKTEIFNKVFSQKMGAKIMNV